MPNNKSDSTTLTAEEQFRQQALDYHALPTAGKIAVSLTKPADSAQDLALAYSPGVAEPVREIAVNADNVYKWESKSARWDLNAPDYFLEFLAGLNGVQLADAFLAKKCAGWLRRGGAHEAGLCGAFWWSVLLARYHAPCT